LGLRHAVKSKMVVPTYAVILLVALLLVQAPFFMMFLVNLCDQLGLLPAVIGIRLIR